MPIYKHTQVGYVTGGALAAAALASGLTLAAGRNATGWVGAILTGSFALGAVLFATLTVTVDRDALHVYFGPGFWRQRIPIDAIERVRMVRNPAYYGWGIRYTPRGWLYNVSGWRAVELEVRGEGTIRIGTDEPEQLQTALETARHAS